MGQYHTIEIEVNRPLTIHKEHWDSMYLDRINASSDVSKSAELAAIVMHSLGGSYVATLCLIGKALTVNKARIERRAPKKGTIKVVLITSPRESRGCD
jgi:protein pelota